MSNIKRYVYILSIRQCYYTYNMYRMYYVTYLPSYEKNCCEQLLYYVCNKLLNMIFSYLKYIRFISIVQ